MADFFATAPSPFPDLPFDEKGRVQISLSALGEEIAVAQLALELYRDADQRGHAVLAQRQPGTPISEDNRRAFERVRRERGIQIRAFAFAADNFVKELAKLAAEPVLGTAGTDALNDFKAAVPAVTHVRDNLHHPEDRSRGLGKHGKPITTEPVQVPGFDVGPNAQVMFIGTTTVNDKLMNTASDGRLVGIDVTEAVIEQMVIALQTVIDSIPWNPGPPMQYPFS